MVLPTLMKCTCKPCMNRRIKYNMKRKNKKPFFSIVIPCYNDGRYAPGCYIDSLLSNILEQGLEKDDYEVIISDDHSIIPYQGTLDRYRDKMNIKFVETDYNFGPGNTRQRGVEAAEGEWVCFADHDDLFYIGALSGVKYLIEQHKEKYVVYSDFNKVDENDHTQVVEKFQDPKLGTWVHGKFYNIENFWKPCKLHFKKDLRTHEDLYLGRLVECALHSIGRNPMYIKSAVYMWVWRRDSISHGSYIRQKCEDGLEHDFLERNFNDFLESQVDSIIDSYVDGIVTRNEALPLTITAMARAFLTVCSFKSRNPEHYLKEIDYYSSRALHRIEDELNTDLTSIKVLVKTIKSDFEQEVNKIANQYMQLTFIEWLTFIDKMDYQSCLDAAKAATAREINEKKTEAIKSIDVPEEEIKEDHRPFFSIIIPC